MGSSRGRVIAATCAANVPRWRSTPTRTSSRTLSASRTLRRKLAGVHRSVNVRLNGFHLTPGTLQRLPGHVNVRRHVSANALDLLPQARRSLSSTRPTSTRAVRSMRSRAFFKSCRNLDVSGSTSLDAPTSPPPRAHHLNSEDHAKRPQHRPASKRHATSSPPPGDPPGP